MHFYIFCNKKNISRSHYDAINEFKKRLSPYCEADLILSQSPFMPEQINKNNCHFFTVTTATSNYSSEDFAKKIMEMQSSGKSHILLYAGYSKKSLASFFYETLNINDIKDISLTGFDLSSETQTVMLFEQIYRSFTIIHGKKYHK